MEFSNSLVGGSDELVREGIQSRGYIPGVTGWRIARDGSAEFSDVSLRGGLIVTNDARSANYSPGVSGWILKNDGTAEFNGAVAMASGVVTGILQSTNYSAGVAGWVLNSNGTAEFNGAVGMASGTVTGSLRSANYSSGVSGWILNSNGTAEFNGALVTTLVDGKVHAGGNSDTSISVLNNTASVTNANPQNTAQVAGHGYVAFVQVAVSAQTAGFRIRYTLWDGAIGGTQLGVNAPVVKINATGGTYETFNMMFAWRAPTTKVIANINLQMEYLQGTAGQSVFTRVDTGSFNFFVMDLGLANAITNL